MARIMALLTENSGRRVPDRPSIGRMNGVKGVLLEQREDDES